MWHIDANREPNSVRHAGYSGLERRTSPRIETPFPATVRSVDINGQPFEAHTILDNFCSRGLYLRLAWQVHPGVRSFVLIRLTVTPSAGTAATFVALHGVVLRTEKRPGRAFGIAIGIIRYRFI